MPSDGKQGVGLQAVESIQRKQARSTGEMMPLLIEEAPSAFRARRFSLERLRKDYGITRRTALEMVLAGLILSEDRGPSARARLRRVA